MILVTVAFVRMSARNTKRQQFPPCAGVTRSLRVAPESLFENVHREILHFPMRGIPQCSDQFLESFTFWKGVSFEDFTLNASSVCRLNTVVLKLILHVSAHLVRSRRIAGALEAITYRLN